MSRRTDLLDAWVRATGDPLKEARCRLRTLARAGWLPMRRQDIDIGDIAIALLGFAVGTQHKTAAEELKRFSEFRCLRVATHGREPPFPLENLRLLDALTTALTEGFWIAEVRVNVTASWCALTTMPHTGNLAYVPAELTDLFARQDALNGAAQPGGTSAAPCYVFCDPTDVPSTAVRPMEHVRVITGDTIARLFTELRNPKKEDAEALPGASASVTHDHLEERVARQPRLIPPTERRAESMGALRMHATKNLHRSAPECRNSPMTTASD